MTTMHQSALRALSFVLLTTACGQGPSFLDLKDTRSEDGGADGGGQAGASADGTESQGAGGGTAAGQGQAADATKASDTVAGNAGGDPGTATNDLDPSAATPGTSPTSTSNIVIPNAAEGDLGALHNCLAKWGNVPLLLILWSASLRLRRILTVAASSMFSSATAASMTFCASSGVKLPIGPADMDAS